MAKHTAVIGKYLLYLDTARLLLLDSVTALLLAGRLGDVSSPEQAANMTLNTNVVMRVIGLRFGLCVFMTTSKSKRVAP